MHRERVTQLETGAPARAQESRPRGPEVQRNDPSELLESVAARLRELEGAANVAANELREEALEARLGAPRPASDGRVAAAVLTELILTLSERAAGIEREAELIAGILERAKEAIEHPGRARAQIIRTVPGRAAPRPTEKAPDARPASAGVKLLAAQMALEGESGDAIRDRLRVEFGVSDAAGAVQEVLGGATPP